MARYHNEFAFQADPTMLFNQMHHYLMSEGYEYRDYEGERVYKKGMGIMTGPSFIKIMAIGGRFIIEGWIKFAILPGVYAGETGITGFVGAVPKSFLRDRVQFLEQMVLRAGGIPIPCNGAQVQLPQAYPQQPYPQQTVRYCPQCRTAIVQGARFCAGCGAAVQE